MVVSSSNSSKMPLIVELWTFLKIDYQINEQLIISQLFPIYCDLGSSVLEILLVYTIEKSTAKSLSKCNGIYNIRKAYLKCAF